MNQRAAKMSKPIGDERINPMTLMQFTRECARQLNGAGYEDSAFYFEQIVDHLRAGKGLTADPRKVSSILGL
tara:strand:+ start:6362 stop:6577 length:216 start_codon:yes stop_codon:yes gene_type:complete